MISSLRSARASADIHSPGMAGLPAPRLFTLPGKPSKITPTVVERRVLARCTAMSPFGILADTYIGPIGLGATLTNDWQEALRAIGFRPHGSLCAMRARVEDVEFDAIPHPLKGLSISVSHVGSRTVTNYERFLPLDCDTRAVATLMTEAFESIHPERRHPVAE